MDDRATANREAWQICQTPISRESKLACMAALKARYPDGNMEQWVRDVNRWELDPTWTSFHVRTSEANRYREARSKWEAELLTRQKAECEGCQAGNEPCVEHAEGHPYLGAIGGGTQWRFYPTSLGTLVSVQIGSEEPISLTDFESL